MWVTSEIAVTTLRKPPPLMTSPPNTRVISASTGREDVVYNNAAFLSLIDRARVLVETNSGVL